MGTNMNFNNFGGERSGRGGGGGGGEGIPLTRQTSIYSLTFDELQNSMGGSIGGKDFGSMNMDELLKNIWTAEENQALAAVAGGANLQRQGSVTLPRTLSQKTVDELWKDMSSKDGGVGASASGAGFPQKQPTLGEITLEEFLVRAGVVREDVNTTQTSGNNGAGAGGGGSYGQLMMPNNNNNISAGMSTGFGGFGFQQAELMTDTNNQMMMQSSNLPLNVNGVRSSHQQSLATSQQHPLFPKQPGLSYANPLGLASPRLRGVPDLGLMQQVGGGGFGMTGLGAGGVTVASGSPAQHSSDGLGRGNGDLSSLSPVPYIFNGGSRGRKANGGVEKVVERRHRRMIKNRESAARSRARKQAYTMELEAEVAKLKEENEELQKKQAEIMEMQKNQVLEMMNNQGDTKRRRLRRTQTGPW